jgi:hypothetical protein
MADNTELSNFNCSANFKSSPLHDSNLFAIFSAPKKNEVEKKNLFTFDASAPVPLRSAHTPPPSRPIPAFRSLISIHRPLPINTHTPPTFLLPEP